MITKTYIDRDAWMQDRKAKITGSTLGKILPKKNGDKKIGFYQLLAEQLSTDPTPEEDDEKARVRGTRLEPEAIARFVIETGKEVDTSLIMWQREDNNKIAVSPDGIIGDTHAIEAKCLSSARHLEAYLTQEIPSDFTEQIMQYFVCNDKLEELFFCFYDPRIPCRDFFYITVKRDQNKVIEYLEAERKILMEIETLVEKLQMIA